MLPYNLDLACTQVLVMCTTLQSSSSKLCQTRDSMYVRKIWYVSQVPLRSGFHKNHIPSRRVKPPQVPALYRLLHGVRKIWGALDNLTLDPLHNFQNSFCREREGYWYFYHSFRIARKCFGTFKNDRVKTRSMFTKLTRWNITRCRTAPHAEDQRAFVSKSVTTYLAFTSLIYFQHHLRRQEALTRDRETLIPSPP